MYPIIFWGDLLRSLRESNCMLQKEMALILHVSRQTYSNLETGRARPSPEQLAILSYIYDVDLMGYIRHCLPQEYLDEQDAFRAYKDKKRALEHDMEAMKKDEPKKKRTARTRPTVIHTYSGREALDILQGSREMVAEAENDYGKTAPQQLAEEMSDRLSTGKVELEDFLSELRAKKASVPKKATVSKKMSGPKKASGPKKTSGPKEEPLDGQTQ